MRGRLKKKTAKQMQHPVDILYDIVKKVAKHQGLKVDRASFKKVKAIWH